MDLPGWLVVLGWSRIFVGLRRLGQPVSMAIYDGEGHWPGTWSYANQVDVVNRRMAWWDQHLKSGPSKVEAAEKGKDREY